MPQPTCPGTQLQPETILHALSDTEDRLWAQGGVTDDRPESLHQTPGDMGSVILQHATCTKKIHGYFSNLEQRKCCLLLAACKQKFSSVRLVRNDGRDSGIEEGAMMKSTMGSSETVLALNSQEFRVFQRALRCAAFPVLGAPDPPTGVTPSPVAGVPHHRPLTLNRTATPHSLHDSGVEDQEDTSMVPAETLCELLRRAFKLSPEKFNQYEEIVASQLEKKSPQKLLAEELVRQLVALENNANPFYSVKTFINRHGYDQWQQRERSHITELIHKFWHFSLPQPSSSSSLTDQVLMRRVHNEYRLLMETLIRYESPYRQESELVAPQPTTPLSSASHRLLKEFGLRYGIGEQYRKVVYLHYLALNFDPTVWFIEHTMMSLTNVMESMPSKRSFLVIVKDEFSMLERSLQLLEAKVSAALGKMKTLFPSDRHSDGIESLIELLSITLQGKSYLLMHAEEQLGMKLQKIIQTIFPTAYERHKMVAEDELRQNKWEVELNPKLLNMLIGNIRDEIQDYRQNYQAYFIRYFNITVEAAQVFYSLLMADVAELQKHKQEEMNSLDINLLMLSLAYRLNQLDQDWATYICPQMQTWRGLSLAQAQHWSVVIKVHMHDIVTQAVSLDKYTTCQLQWSGSLHQPSSSTSTSPRNRTLSKSLTPSVNSAFSSLSSPYSTPAFKPMPGPISHPQPVPEVSREQEGNTDPKTNNLFTSTSHTLFAEKRPNSDPVNISRSSMLNGSYLGDMAMSLDHYDNDQLFLSFMRMRHSSSLPNMQCINGQRTIEMETRTISKTQKLQPAEDTMIKQTQTRSPQRLDSNDGMSSLEVSNLLENPVIAAHNESECELSCDSQTLTDDSDSQVGEYQFPPLEEVNIVSSSPMYNVDSKPVTMAGDLDKHSSVVRPSTPAYVDSGLMQKPTLFAQQTSFSSTSDQPDSGKISHDSEDQQFHDDITNIEKQYKTSADTNGIDSLTDSLISNVSFSFPQSSPAAILSVSSSAIDVAVILQRMVGLGKTLCQTLVMGKWSAGSDPSTLQSSDDDDVFHLPQNSAYRQKLYDSFLEAICSTVCQYADNMLCMDLCGNSSSTACRLAGPRLVEYLQTQQRSGLVWGCRHNVAGTNNCFNYLNRQTDLLCDRHEPITMEMCTRINNVLAMLSFLDWYHHRLGNVFCVFSDWSVRQKHLTMSINSTEILRSEFIVLENYGYNPEVDSGDVMETVSQRCPSAGDSSRSSVPVVVSSPVDSYRNHLMAILRAQCRLIAYRLNLFVADALPVLLTLKGRSVPLEAGLKPITDFLTDYITALGAWLYRDSFRRVLECLWIFIVQDFETELEHLEGMDDDTEARGQLLLQALSHLLRFMNGQHSSLRKELLLCQAENVSFRLSLYSMPVSLLIAIYRGLVTDSARTEASSMDSQYQTVLRVRQRLQADLQLLRKGFSGTELVRWIVTNQELFVNFDPVLAENSVTFSMETAYHVAQRLLDWKLIADVEGETGSGLDRSLTNSLTSFVFPTMTIFSQFSGRNHPERPSSRGSDDSTPQATPFTTPCATPRPTLKASLRASSRLSGFKSATPAGRLLDKQQHSNKPQKPEGSDKDDTRQSVQAKPSAMLVSVDVHKNPTEMLVESIEEVESPNEQDIGATVIRAGTRTECVDGGESGNQLLTTSAVREDMVGQQSANDISRNIREWDSLATDAGDGFNNDAQLREAVYDGEEFDPYLKRGTSMSLTSGISCESRGPVFIHSPDTFYFVCPFVGQEPETSLKNYELFHLVEQCFQKKVSPDYIMRIIYSRRRHSEIAKNFIRASPADVIDYMKHLYDTEDSVPTCVSS